MPDSGAPKQDQGLGFIYGTTSLIQGVWGGFRAPLGLFSRTTHTVPHPAPEYGDAAICSDLREEVLMWAAGQPRFADQGLRLLRVTQRLLSSSFLGFHYGILNMNHKEELLRSLWVIARVQRGL